MRIIQIINALTLGGAQFFLADLVIESVKAGNNVMVLAFRDGPIGEKLRHEGIEVKILGETSLDLPAAYSLFKIVKDYQPDLIHSHLFRATFWARVVCKYMAGLPLISSIHGCETRIFHKLEKLTQKKSDYLLFPSFFLKNWYDKNICRLPDSRCKVLYPGVGISAAPPMRKESDLIAIGTLSRLHPVKGIDRLIRACARLRGDSHNFKLVIGGSGSQRNALQRLAKECELTEICHFIDDIKDKNSFLNNLDIFVAPSRQEAFGIHICEAMERGLPIVAANVGGIPELVEHEQTGLLFSHDDENQLYHCLKRLVNEPASRCQMGDRARLNIESNFNRNISIFDHLKLYGRLSSKRHSAHFVISSSELGGGENIALGLMNGLSRRDWKISATCAGSPLAERILDEGIDCDSGGMRSGGLFFALKLLCNRDFHRADIINAHLNRASLVSGLLAGLFRKPLVSHVHGLNNKSYYRYSKNLIAVSQAVKNHMTSQGIEEKQVRIFANRINKPSLHPRANLNEVLTICITAKLHPNKGHRWALEALGRNFHMIQPCRIIILGDGPEKTNLEKLCYKNGLKKVVQFAGFVKSPDDYYPNVDLALLPSLGEGIPLCLLETMRFGIPCIATRVGGIPEIISDGENGLLIKPGDETALVEAIQKFRDHAFYRRMSIGAINHYNLVNDFEKQISEIENYFIGLIGNKAVRQ